MRRYSALSILGVFAFISLITFAGTAYAADGGASGASPYIPSSSGSMSESSETAEPDSIVPSTGLIEYAPVDVSRSYSASNKYVGAGYDYYSRGEVRLNGLLDNDKMTSTTQLEATGKLFGLEVELVRARLYAKSRYGSGGERYTGASLRRLGSTVHDKTGTTDIDAEWSHDKVFIDKSKSFPIPGVPLTITVRGKVTGSYGLDLMARTRPTFARGVATPFVRSTAKAWVSVGIPWAAEAGVGGEVDIVKAEIPTETKVELGSAHFGEDKKVTATQTAERELTFLSGNLFVWGRLLGKYGKKTIFKWAGVHRSDTLRDETEVDYH